MKKYSDTEALGILKGPNNHHVPYLFEKSPQPMLFVSASGKILDANEAFCELLEYTLVEIINRKISDITHPEDMETNESLLSRFRSGVSDSYIFLKRYLSKRGRSVPCLVYAYAIRDQDKCIIYTIKSVTPIQNGLVEKLENLKSLQEQDDKTWKVKVFDYVLGNFIQIIFVLVTLLAGLLFLMNMNENLKKSNDQIEQFLEKYDEQIEN
jgi:PAS domain S-box-containing protein